MVNQFTFLHNSTFYAANNPPEYQAPVSSVRTLAPCGFLHAVSVAVCPPEPVSLQPGS